MDPQELRPRFAALTTAHLADACVRAGVPVRYAPPGTRPVVAVPLGSSVFGPVLPARHAGSVDVFLEALESAVPGEVLVVDNAGRFDEACVGDLMALEAASAGLAGMVIWGLHRDTAEIAAIGLPVFSLGALAAGPRRLDPLPDDALTVAMVGEHRIDRSDLVLGDDDGVLFVPAAQAAELCALAESIRDTERRQAGRIRSGVSLRDQLEFGSYLAARERTPALTFREHLRGIGGAIEE